MQINDFKLFLEVAELGSLTKVAVQRNTVQSHISRQISDLESECGAALFRRTGRGVVLTEFGQDVALKARQWIQQSEQLFGEIKQSAKMPIGAVKIGILPSAAHPLMTEVFQKIHLQYPKIQLNIREGQGSELDALLDSGSVDIAILFRYDKPSKSDEILLSTASTYLVSSPDLPLTQNDTVDLKMLDGVELVLPRKGSHWRSILDESARSQGFQLKSVIEADSLTVQKEIIASNPNIYALLGPFSIDEGLSSGRLKSSKLVNPELNRYVTLATPNYGYLTQATRIVIETIQSTVLSWNNQLNPTSSTLKAYSDSVKN